MAYIQRVKKEICQSDQKRHDSDPSVFPRHIPMILFLDNGKRKGIQTKDKDADDVVQPAALFLPVVIHNTSGKGFEPKMQVVCQNAQHQDSADDDQQYIPARQGLILRAMGIDGEKKSKSGSAVMGI